MVHSEMEHDRPYVTRSQHNEIITKQIVLFHFSHLYIFLFKHLQLFYLIKNTDVVFIIIFILITIALYLFIAT